MSRAFSKTEKLHFPSPGALPLSVQNITYGEPVAPGIIIAGASLLPVTGVNDRAKRPLIILSPSCASLGTRRISQNAVRLRSAQVVASRAVWPITLYVRRPAPADKGRCDIGLRGAYDTGFLFPDFLVFVFGL